MNYIYDVFLNYNKKYYDFFEWNENDLFIHFKKIPVIRVSHETIVDVLSKKVTFSDQIKEYLQNKSEIYSKKGIIKETVYCILSDDKNAIGIELDDNQNIINLSSMIPEEENDAVEIIKKKPVTKLDYLAKKIKHNYIFKTRSTIKKEIFIKNKLKHIYNDKNYELLDYLYYECYGNDKKDKKIADFLNQNIDTLYNLLKTINI